MDPAVLSCEGWADFGTNCYEDVWGRVRGASCGHLHAAREAREVQGCFVVLFNVVVWGCEERFWEHVNKEKGRTRGII